MSKELLIIILTHKMFQHQFLNMIDNKYDFSLNYLYFVWHWFYDFITKTTFLHFAVELIRLYTETNFKIFTSDRLQHFNGIWILTMTLLFKMLFIINVVLIFGRKLHILIEVGVHTEFGRKFYLHERVIKF